MSYYNKHSKFSSFHRKASKITIAILIVTLFIVKMNNLFCNKNYKL